MSEPSRHTPLRSVHEDLGARMIDFAGWQMPVWYGGATEEHHAVRHAAGLFDLSHMAELFVSGTGAAAALEWSLLIEATAMPVGRARYTMICNEAGGILDDLIVYRLADESFMVVANASNGPTVHRELQNRCSGFEAVVADRTDEFALIAVQGPIAETLVTELTGPALADLAYYRVALLDILGVPAFAARTGYTGEDGFELFVPGEAAIELWQRLMQSGESRGLVAVGLAARDTLRLEAGMPLYGNELSVETTPFDVGAARLVKPRPSGFVGADALAAAAEQPHRALVGLHIEGRRPARTDYLVSHHEAQIGVVTSGAISPTLGRPIAIASVETPPAQGESVEVDVRGSAVNAKIVELPFYRRTT